MASPLSVFRKHQFILMVGLVFVALGSFVVVPSIDEYLRSASTPASDDDSVVVDWDTGVFRQRDIDRMRQAHGLAVFYLSAVIRETLGRDGTPRGRGVTRSVFQQIVDPGIPASSSDENLVYTSLLAKKAESLGMVVSQEAVVEFLEQLSDGVLPQSEFGVILKNTLSNRVTEEFLLDQLRTELLAQRMRETMESGLYVPPPGALTPGRAWQYFQRLNRMVQADLVSLPVGSFYDQLGSPPSDETLQADIYKEGKDRFPDPNFPEPGFKRRRRAEFHFVRADFNRFLEAEKAKLLPEITDEEIETEYENNKSRYVIPTAPPEPEAALVPTDGEPEGAGTVDSPDTDSSSESEPPSTDAAEPAETPESDDQGSLNGPKHFFVSSVSQDQPDSSESGNVPTGEATEEAAAATEITEPDESGIEDQSVAANPDEADSESSESEETSEEVNYRPLDEGLRAEIREELADNQARKPAQDRLENSLTQIRRQVDAYARKLRGREFSKADAEPMEAFSLEQLELDELLETGDLPLVDAISVKEYELGQAFETEFVSWPPRRIEFDQVAFQEGISLYRPGQISGADSGITFVYWKTENREPEVPEFSDVRDEVVEAWKRIEALKLAQQKAEELSTAANAKSGERLTEILAGQEAHSVVTTDLFSWLSTGLNPSGMGAPGISNVEGVEGIGPSFMESVFALDQGEAGVAINQPENVVYVVKIVIESPTEDVLRQRFLESGVTFEVSSIANEDNIQLQRQWYDDLEREFGVVWRRPPE